MQCLELYGYTFFGQSKKCYNYIKYFNFLFIMKKIYLFNDDYFYSSTSINQAILLEEQLFSGVTTGNQRAYTDNFTTEIADVEIISASV